MKTIVMDTSSHYLAIALFDQDVKVQGIQVQALKKQSELAIPYLKELLDKQQWSLDQMETMVISIGPGSYTGVRIALTIAKTLAATLTIQIKAISSLAMLAHDKKVMSVIDARGGKYYVGLYDQGQSITSDQLMTSEQLEVFKESHEEYKIVTFDDEIDLCQSLYDLSLKQDRVIDTDALVPTYIKEVEAKKQC